MSVNHKSRLNEYCLDRWRSTPKYQCSRSASPHTDHEPLFDATVTLPNQLKYSAKAVPGRARDAEQEAAKMALSFADRAVQIEPEEIDNALDLPLPRKPHARALNCTVTKVSHHWAEARGLDSSGKGVTLKLKGAAMIGAREGDALEVRVIVDK